MSGFGQESKEDETKAYALASSAGHGNHRLGSRASIRKRFSNTISAPNRRLAMRAPSVGLTTERESFEHPPENGRLRLRSAPLFRALARAVAQGAGFKDGGEVRIR